MGRSRKPLTGQPVRGFESHPLRHSPSSRAERAVLDAQAPGDLLYGFRSTRRAVPGGPATPRLMTQTWKKAVPRETDFSTQQSSPQADARIPGADAHPPRPGRDRPAAPEGTQAPERLMPGQRLPSEERLRRRADYLRCYRTGRRRHGPSPGVPARRLQAPPLSPAPPRLPFHSDLLGVCPAGASQIRLLAREPAGRGPPPALPAFPSGRDRSALNKGLKALWTIAG